MGIFPGSFDPLTNGHLDVVKRANRLFDKLVVAVARNTTKAGLFTINERIEILEKCCREVGSNIEIVSFDGLLVDYCKKNNISFIIRGLRNAADYEYEKPIESINRKLYSGIETVFFMAREEHSSISSNIIREIATFNGDISSLVPHFVVSKIQEKFSGR